MVKNLRFEKSFTPEFEKEIVEKELVEKQLARSLQKHSGGLFRGVLTGRESNERISDHFRSSENLWCNLSLASYRLTNNAVITAL